MDGTCKSQFCNLASFQIWGVTNVNFNGSPSTWWNGTIDNQCIFKRLDRYVMSQACMVKFGIVEAEHLARTGSDHAPMLLTCGQQNHSIRRPLRFLKFWTKEQIYSR